MTKDVFLSMIEHSLTDAGMPKEKVDESIAHFNASFSRMSNEEFEEKVSQLGGVEVISERVVSNYKKSVQKKARSVQSENIDTASDADSADEIKEADEEKESADAANETAEAVAAEPATPTKIEPKQSVNELLREDDDIVKPKPRKKAPGVQNSKGGKGKKKKSKGKNSAAESKPKAGTFAATPVVALLMIIAVACFAFLYGVVGGLVVILAAALVLLSASGTALSIVAIIYGITQLSVSKGAGLYEMGIGIVAGGVTLFFGILMYNFIVRLAPFIFKKLLVLFKFVFKKIMLLFHVIKEACDNR